MRLRDSQNTRKRKFTLEIETTSIQYIVIAVTKKTVDSIDSINANFGSGKIQIN
jgi:hypothetical protein